MANKYASKSSHWISFSDIMTGLMVIFMFIAISYMLEVQKKQEERDLIFEEFKATQENLFYELESEFSEDFKKWQVELDNDLSIKFTNPSILFASGKSNLSSKFEDILSSFLPRYFDVLLREEYLNKIAEVRIEGHTDNSPIWRFDDDPYIGNIKLSQDRSAEVLKYFRSMKYFKELDSDSESKLQYWLTANGLSYGRMLDKNKKLAMFSGDQPDNTLSRRVEFRIITSSDSLVQKVLDNL